MSDPQQFEKDLREYLDKEPNMHRLNKIDHLRELFNKHFELSKAEHLVKAKDFHDIFSGAKFAFANLKMPVRITRKQLEPSEATHVALLESFISYLNKNSLLKKPVSFDFTE